MPKTQQTFGHPFDLTETGTGIQEQESLPVLQAADVTNKKIIPNITKKQESKFNRKTLVTSRVQIGAA